MIELAVAGVKNGLNWAPEPGLWLRWARRPPRDRGRHANAGHPPALLDDGGHVEYLDNASGAMLGASADTDYTASHQRLAPGARLLLYTDGLIEDRRRDITEGLSALARAVQRSRTQTAERTCQFVQTAMLGSGTRADDICILTICRDQPPGWGPTGGTRRRLRLGAPGE